MSVSNTYQVKVDIKKKLITKVPEVIANDKVVFEVEVLDNGTVFPLDESYIYYLVSKSYKKDANAVIRQGTLTNGKIVFALGSSEFEHIGKVEATVQIFDSTNKRVSTAYFDYKVVKDNSFEGDLPNDEKNLVIVNESVLNGINDKLNLNIENPNLVDKLEKLIQARGMYARVASDNSLRIGIGMNETLKSVIEYRFVYNADGLLLLRGVLAGVENPNANRFNPTLNGSFNTSTAGQAYTTTIGDKFTFSFTGSNLFFKRYCEVRGGVWKFTLSNGMTRNVSCYSTTTGYVEDLIFDNLPFGTYQGVAEFMGADTFDTDTTVVRGYLFYSVNESSVKPLRVGKVLPINETTAKYIVSESSVPDYAMQGKKAGSSVASVWTPVHGSVTGVSSNIAVKIQIDGVTEVSNISTLPNFTYKDIKSFYVSQQFEVYHPNALSDGVLWKHVLNHIIDERNPYLTVQNSMRLLQDVVFATGYFGMLPSKQSTMSRLLLNNGIEYATLPSTAQEDYYDYDITSAAFVGENTSDSYHACAIDVSSVTDAYNIKKEFEPTQKARISFREDNIAKVYFTAFRSSTVPSGTKLQCQNRICCVSGIQYPNESLGL